jgi:molecular chaperone HscC
MIGIDLGTTNSLVAVMKEGRPVTLQNELGEDLIPSAVAVAKSGELLVGRAAKDRLVSAPDAGKAFFKRDMGIATKYFFGGRAWTPTECSAVVLRELKRIAEENLKVPVTSAVITVPAYFHDLQRQATLEAAGIAGLKVERLVNEPTAAALAYGFRADSNLSTLLVFDLGGGTFDVTVLDCFEGVIEVKASAGESRLGGEDYTDLLAAWIMEKFQWKPHEQDMGRWREKVEQLKRRLSKDRSAMIHVNGREEEVSRSDFQQATSDLTLRLRPVVRRALRDAKITSKHLDAVLFVGGASRMPLVFEQLRDDLGLPAEISMDPDRVVALGAAVQQALCAGHQAVSELVLTDVCPHTLGVEVTKRLSRQTKVDGYYSPIIDRNTTLPVSRSHIYSTLEPDQDVIELRIYQGEGRLVRDNQKIGQISITGLRHRPGQKHPGEIDVRFTYGMNGVLEVEVTICETGEILTQVFEQRPGMLTTEQIAEAVRRMQTLKIHPRQAPVNQARLERANRLYKDLTGDLRDELDQLTIGFEESLHSQDDTKIKRDGEKLDAFMKRFFDDE